MPGLVNNKQDMPTVSMNWATVMGESIASLQWDRHGHLYAGCVDGDLAGYQIDGETLFRRTVHSEAVSAISVQQVGKQLASCSEDGQVLISDALNGDQLVTVANDGQWCDVLAWSPDDQVLACAIGKKVIVHHADGENQSWDQHPGVVGALAWAPSGKRLASGTNKGVYLWNLGSWDPVKVLDFPGAAISIAWTGDGRALAAGTQDGFMHVRLQSPGTTPRQLSMSGYPGKVSCLAWHPRRQHRQYCIATCGGRELVLWWINASNAQRRALPLRRHEQTVTALAWSYDGSCLVSGDRSGRVCFWSASGDFVSEMEMGAEITTLDWHPSCNQLAIGNIDGSLCLFSMHDATPAQTPGNH